MEVAVRAASVGSFIALGDSFTEGLADARQDGGYRGWADRFAEHLAARNPGLRYANLAVRGKMLGEVVSQQLPVAVAMAPELVSIAAGGNDLLRRSDPDLLADVFDGAVAQLREAGSEVLLFTGFDTRTFPILRWIRGRVAIYNMHLRAIADRYGCAIVDLWSMPVLCDRRAWSDDRLHLAAEGHRRVALRACEAVGVPPGGDWREPLPMLDGALSPAMTGWLAARQLDARWARRYAAPWVRRRIRGVSSGDGLQPKRAELLPLDIPGLATLAEGS
jgi:lysophospholipase L1-like esterase